MRPRNTPNYRFLSGGQGEGPQRWSLPFFGYLHDEISHSCKKSYSSNVFAVYVLSWMQRHGSTWWCPRWRRCLWANSPLEVHYHSKSQHSPLSHKEQHLAFRKAFRQWVRLVLPWGSGCLSGPLCRRLARSAVLWLLWPPRRGPCSLTSRARIKDRDKVFLLDGPALSSGLIGDVNRVVSRFWQVNSHEILTNFSPWETC